MSEWVRVNDGDREEEKERESKGRGRSEGLRRSAKVVVGTSTSNRDGSVLGGVSQGEAFEKLPGVHSEGVSRVNEGRNTWKWKDETEFKRAGFRFRRVSLYRASSVISLVDPPSLPLCLLPRHNATRTLVHLHSEHLHSSSHLP